MPSDLELAMSAYCEGNYIDVELIFHELKTYQTPEKIMLEKEKLTMDSLSAQAKIVMGLIFESPADLLHLIKFNQHDQLTLTMLKFYLRECLNWNRRTIETTIIEIKTELEST